MECRVAAEMLAELVVMCNGGSNSYGTLKIGDLCKHADHCMQVSLMACYGHCDQDCQNQVHSRSARGNWYLTPITSP